MGLYLFNFRNIDAVKNILRALQHPLRKKLIHHIDKNPGCSVTEIYISLRLEQSVASQHLGALRAAGILITERQGKNVLYKLKQEALELIEDLCGKIIIAAGTDPSKPIKKYAGLPPKN
jgi:DNA-binding transcriptional ArsR family regulator